MMTSSEEAEIKARMETFPNVIKEVEMIHKSEVGGEHMTSNTK